MLTTRDPTAERDRGGAWLGSSQMGEMVREFDWSETPLGPIAGWSQSLKSALAICLRCPFQMAIYWGPELCCIYNDAEREVLGRLHPGALGQPARELLRDLWDVVGPQLQAASEREETTWMENQPLSVDRRGQLEVGYFTYSYSPILDDDGSVGGVLLVTKETTARVLAERRIEAFRELADATMDASTATGACELAARVLARGPDIPFALVYMIDEPGKRAICTASDAGGLPLEVTHPVVALDAPLDEISDLFRRAAAERPGGILTPSGWFVGVRDMSAIPRQVLVAALAPGGADRVDGYLVTGVREDIALDKAYEDFLKMLALGVGRSVASARAREAQRKRVSELAAIERAKTALFSNASHELRTPLTLILGHLDELLVDDGLADGTRGIVQVAHRSALRMLKLVNALLEFSRIEAGESIGAFEVTDIAQLTGEIAAMFHSAAERAGLRLIVDCPSLAPAPVDRDAWERIVSNLISNALKFTPQGEIRVRTRAENGHLCLTVEDTGIGIAPEDLEQIFSRFYRSPDSRARTHEGSGIGLALVRELALVHDGSVEAVSRPNEGTRMTVRIPLVPKRHVGDDLPRHPPSSRGPRSAALFVAEAEGWLDGQSAPPASDDDEALTLNAEATSNEPGLERPRVLVVEDNMDMREYLRRLLARHFSVMLARDGDAARELALLDPPSLIISDVMMPGLDGFGLIRELRCDDRTRDVPVILLSARADPESTVHALDLGADDYIIKPFGAPELLARVRATLQNSHARVDAAEERGRMEERTRHRGDLRALLNDLRAAQRRVAFASDGERRRIERDLHDGAQQRLMAIRLELGLLSERLEEEPRVARERLDELRTELDEAVEELRTLAHGVYPPLLASDGLYAALASAAVHSAIPVSLEAGEISRAPRAIESAAYFCCLEALQNATKHAGQGASATVELSTAGGILEFSVSDDGVGFDPTAVGRSHGLINLQDRIEALGGDIEVTSSPGKGATIRGQIPLP